MTNCKNCGHEIVKSPNKTSRWLGLYIHSGGIFCACGCNRPQPASEAVMDSIKPTNSNEEANVEYGCCARCGKALPKALLHPFKGRRPSAKLFCPECTSALVDSLERSMP